MICTLLHAKYANPLLVCSGLPAVEIAFCYLHNRKETTRKLLKALINNTKRITLLSDTPNVDLDHHKLLALNVHRSCPNEMIISTLLQPIGEFYEIRYLRIIPFKPTSPANV